LINRGLHPFPEIYFKNASKRPKKEVEEIKGKNSLPQLVLMPGN
jgi:hypothetical protein